MDPIYNKVRKKVARKKKFYKELWSFVSTSILLIFINVFTSPSYMWAFWPIGFWGASMVIKGAGIFFAEMSEDWEENEIKKELLAKGKDPDYYFEKNRDHRSEKPLKLKRIDREPMKVGRSYKKSDLV